MDLAEAKEEYGFLLARVGDPGNPLAGALVAVAALHRPTMGFDGSSRSAVPVCVECELGDGIAATWPCTTTVAIRDAIQ